MAKKKAAAKKPAKVKTEKQKLWDKRKEFHDNLPDSERNPEHEKDFEKVLSKLFPPVKAKGVNYTKKKKGAKD